MIQLTRSYPFSASHRLHSDALSDRENTAIYGKCNNPYGHGHNYVLEVSVTGEVRAATGRVVDVGRLDQIVREAILDPLDNRSLNEDVREFKSQVPTTENLVTVVENRLKSLWPQEFPRLSRIRLHEDRKNIFELQVGL